MTKVLWFTLVTVKKTSGRLNLVPVRGVCCQRATVACLVHTACPVINRPASVTVDPRLKDLRATVVDQTTTTIPSVKVWTIPLPCRVCVYSASVLKLTRVAY